MLPFVILALLAIAFSASGQDGFCTQNGGTTGGVGGTTVTVTNGTDFNTYATSTARYVVQVQGVLSVGQVKTKSNKSFIGVGTNATLFGNLDMGSGGVTNIIIQNLRISNPSGDGLTIWGTSNVWVDHCTFWDCGDGASDITRGADWVTLSWCKFHYLNQVEHRFVMIGGNTPESQYHSTVHHCWFASGSYERMPAASYSLMHFYNDYFNCTNNGYSTDARTNAQLLVENSYYSGVHNPIYKESNGKIKTSGNVYVATTGTPPDSGTDTLFAPPYAYSLDAATNVPSLVAAGAGAPGPDAVPIPPKIWDGGGADNNLNTANNWGLNETPKRDDALLFAGNTRLTPNNNISANTDFYNLAFSNNAGAFVIGGNAMNLGSAITDDSASVETINLNLDFSFGLDHYGTNRAINISSPSGSLIINGSIAGNTNAYFNSYCLTKQGPGLLTLNGMNTFIASLQLNGGLIQFSTLDTNLPGNLGTGAVIKCNGGGLRWAPGNTADISTRTLTLQSGGATFDSGTNSITLVSPVGNGGSGGLTKSGTGKITLNGNNNYSGPTLISQGTLALGPAGALANSSQIILSNNATLDVAGRSDGMLTLGSGKTLTGNGSVLGSVTAASGATLSPGSSVGIRVITNILTLQAGSTNLMQLDKSASTNDLLTGMKSVSYGGRLILTNLNGSLAAGDTFKLFSSASYSGSFSTIVWPPLTGNLFWTNKLAVDGTISVVLPVNTTPTNITCAVAGNVVQITWPADHIGWHLEAQTNASGSGLGTNWVPMSGSSMTNQVTLRLSHGNPSVFFRLAYP